MLPAPSPADGADQTVGSFPLAGFVTPFQQDAGSAFGIRLEDNRGRSREVGTWEVEPAVEIELN